MTAPYGLIMQVGFHRLCWLGLALALALPIPTAAQDGQYSAVIFFDWGKLEISRDSAATLDNVVETISANPGRLVRLDGFSDRSGPEGVNRRISLQRARLVRNYLVGRGVSAARIRLGSHGEKQVLIATDDGVREVQNRRVEIRLTDNGDNGGGK